METLKLQQPAWFSGPALHLLYNGLPIEAGEAVQTTQTTENTGSIRVRKRGATVSRGSPRDGADSKNSKHQRTWKGGIQGGKQTLSTINQPWPPNAGRKQ